MRCSTDLRQRVIVFVRGGGSKAEAARRFQVGRASVHRWVGASDGLSYQRPGPRGSRRLNWEVLRQQVAQHPDRTQQEWARQFGVSRHCIWHALRQMGLTYKKTLGYRERDPAQRHAYRCLREDDHRQGKTFVYVDESGFAPGVTRRYAYAPKGQRVAGEITGQKRPRTSLLAARFADGFYAPVLFPGICNTAVFNGWLEQQLCPLLKRHHVVVMDHASFHKNATTRALIAAQGATLLFLPPYSPDLNPIEHDFAHLKKRREYQEHETLDSLIRNYQ